MEYPPTTIPSGGSSVSIRYVAAVLDHVPNLTATEKLILVALADYASDDTRQCWPSIKTIARRACCDRRTAQRRLRTLEARGLIETAAGGHQYGRNSSSSYRLKFDHHGQIVEDTYPQGRHDAAGGAAPVRDKGGAQNTQGRHSAAPSVIDPSSDPKRATKVAGTKMARVRAAAARTDDELEELARNGKLTAEEEHEREYRRRGRSHKARGLERAQA